MPEVGDLLRLEEEHVSPEDHAARVRVPAGTVGVFAGLVPESVVQHNLEEHGPVDVERVGEMRFDARDVGMLNEAAERVFHSNEEMVLSVTLTPEDEVTRVSVKSASEHVRELAGIIRQQVGAGDRNQDRG